MICHSCHSCTSFRTEAEEPREPTEPTEAEPSEAEAKADRSGGWLNHFFVARLGYNQANHGEF